MRVSKTADRSRLLLLRSGTLPQARSKSAQARVLPEAAMVQGTPRQDRAPETTHRVRVVQSRFHSQRQPLLKRITLGFWDFCNLSMARHIPRRFLARRGETDNGRNISCGFKVNFIIVHVVLAVFGWRSYCVRTLRCTVYSNYIFSFTRPVLCIEQH